jgi:hypothetical protein
VTQGYLPSHAASASADIWVRFYDTETLGTGTLLFEEDEGTVPLTGGIYTITIGAVSGGITDSALDEPEVWVELTVDTVVHPRTRLFSVPYSIKAISAEQLVIPDTFDAAVTLDSSGELLVGSLLSGGGELSLFDSHAARALHLIGDAGDTGSYLSLYGGTRPYHDIRFFIDPWDSRTGQDGGALLELVNSSFDLQTTVRIDADDSADTSTYRGGAQIELFNGQSPTNRATIRIDASDVENGFERDGVIEIRDHDGHPALLLHSTRVANAPTFSMWMGDGSFETVELFGQETVEEGARLNLYDANGAQTVKLDAQDLTADGGAVLELRNRHNDRGVIVDGDDDTPLDDGGEILVFNGVENVDRVTVWINGSDAEFGYNNQGAIRIFDDNTHEAIRLHSNITNDAPEITLLNDSRIETVRIIAQDGATADQGGQIDLYRGDGLLTVDIDSNEGGSQGAAIKLYDAAGAAGGNPTIELDADYGGAGIGRVITDELQITGGCDLSEQFDVSAVDGPVEPGMVVSIDPQRPGELVVSSKPYDQKVAGIISGAGGIKPGMLMAQSGSIADGAYPVALTGRVWCWADASFGAIEPGDRLTTSSTPGHAMTASDRQSAPGAVIGKAMSSLTEGRGLVLVLVQPQ